MSKPRRPDLEEFEREFAKEFLHEKPPPRWQVVALWLIIGAAACIGVMAFSNR